MRDLITVARFTFKEMVKRKSFIVSNIIILLFVVILFNVPNIMNAFKEDSSSKGEEDGDNKIVVVDQDNFYQGTLESLNQADLGYQFEIVTQEKSQDEIKEQINNKEIKAAIVITKEDDQITANYITESLGMSGVPSSIDTVLTENYKTIQLMQAGLSQEQISEINKPINFITTETKEGSSGSMLVLAMILCIVLFYAIYFCAYQVSSSITTEKTSKIMETLVTSASPRTIVLGKTLGIGVAGILQVLAIVIVAFVSFKLFIPSGFLENIIDISKITPQFAIITLIYFILGYILYAFLYALTGSTVSKPEDINSANTPVVFITLISFYLAYFSMMNPVGSINTFASMFPFSSPFSMPFRFIGGTATIVDLIISLAILVVTILIIANVAIKIYSSAILHYGTKLSMKDIFSMYKQK